MKTFGDIYAATPAAAGSAPGRVGLLGEHTDYNDGYMLLTATPQRATVSVRENGGSGFHVYSADLDRVERFTLEHPPQGHFASSVHGCLREARDSGATVRPLDIHVASTVPIGIGLSSTAALEIATLRAVRELLATSWDDVTLARLARQAEIRSAGVHCGIMDPMAASLADDAHMLFLDTRILQRDVIPLPADSEILVIDSGIPRSLAATACNTRRAECAEAARRLGVGALRDLVTAEAVERLPAPLSLRARHVISENARVLEAARGVTARLFGQLMNASHGSLRDDYEVSVLALDQLVELLQGDSSVYGARLTGTGFGGACVALCHAGMAGTVGSRVVSAYNRTGAVARVLVPGGSGSGANPH